MYAAESNRRHSFISDGSTSADVGPLLFWFLYEGKHIFSRLSVRFAEAKFITTFSTCE